MSMTRPLAATAAALVLFLAACGSDADTASDTTVAETAADTSAAADETTTTAAAGSEATEAETESSEAPARTFPATPGELALGTTGLGDVLVDGEGNVIYLFVPDGQGESTCYDACEAAWPVVGEAAGVADGLDAALLGTTTRTDGSVQATYNGWPLYYFAGDNAPGDTNGQTLNDAWYVLDAAGEGVS